MSAQVELEGLYEALFVVLHEVPDLRNLLLTESDGLRPVGVVGSTGRRVDLEVVRTVSLADVEL